MGSAARLGALAFGALAYMALAVWGGGWGLFFANPARIGGGVVLVLLSAMGFWAGGNLSSGVREDRENRWVLPIFGVIGLLDAFLPAYCDRVGFWVFGGEALRWVGVGLFAAGGVLRIFPVRILGRRFSGLVAIQPGHEMVTGGLYRTIRNPSYLGLLISTLGWGLAFRSGVGVLLMAALIPPLVARMGAEERLLESQFGDAYRAYRARTWRLIPGLY